MSLSLQTTAREPGNRAIHNLVLVVEIVILFHTQIIHKVMKLVLLYTELQTKPQASLTTAKFTCTSGGQAGVNVKHRCVASRVARLTHAVLKSSTEELPIVQRAV